ncbi:MAG: NimC/NimA family protein [Clostridiales bacterium]|nr:NimC/NimA family protein [Clostridiales bacterium]
MSKITEVLKEAKVFYVATVDGDQPRVRPFGAITDIDGVPYTCTNNTKNVYKQLMKNPKAEICGVLPDGKWVRITCTLVRDDSDEKRRIMLEQEPGLKRMYSVGDGIFEVLRFENVEGYIYSFTSEPQKITD